MNGRLVAMLTRKQCAEIFDLVQCSSWIRCAAPFLRTPIPRDESCDSFKRNWSLPRKPVSGLIGTKNFTNRFMPGVIVRGHSK